MIKKLIIDKYISVQTGLLCVVLSSNIQINDVYMSSLTIVTLHTISY